MKTKYIILVCILLVTGWLATFPTSAGAVASILYAKPVATGTGDCSTWANACTLQTALSEAVSGNEIWVMTGVHIPGTARTSSFQLKSDVGIYGGFAGTETDREQRDPDTYLTILSGDIDGNDSQTPVITNLETVTGNTTNSYHVITGSLTNSTAVLDGLVITAGFSDGAYPDNVGGGMYIHHGSPTLKNVTFSGNSASYNGGGGMFNRESSPQLVDVTFSGNSAYIGGGMWNFNSSNPSLTNVTFSGNFASIYGGGMYNESSSPDLFSVTFSGNSAQNGGGVYNENSSPTLKNMNFNDNSATTSGGGMYNYNSRPQLVDVTFSGNSAIIGGGMYNYNSSPDLVNITFSGNSANSNGGGVYNNNSNPRLVKVTFSGNSAISGGGMYNYNSSPDLVNITFSGNSANSNGGGMYNSSSSPNLFSVTLSGNSAKYGGGMYNSSSNLSVHNTILWGNSASSFVGAQIYNASSTPTISYSVIEGSGGSTAWDTSFGTDGGGNLDADPKLGILKDYGGPGRQVFPLLPGSSAIDTGDDSNCSANDQRGDVRPHSSGCDIGSYEYALSEFSCNYVSEIPVSECEALVSLYINTDGDNWTDNTGWLETDTPCGTPWFGVSCGSTGHVEDLYLGSNQLAGSIPPELGNLSNLHSLRLNDNQLTGGIPSELGNLSSLIGLNLAFNQLTGGIPPELGNLSSLNVLMLSINQFTGNIPPELGNLSTLSALVLNNNQLTGSIPSELGNLSNLISLTLRSNPTLIGPLPLSLTNLGLTTFSFSETALCEPGETAFQNWLDGITNLQRTNVACSEIWVDAPYDGLSLRYWHPDYNISITIYETLTDYQSSAPPFYGPIVLDPANYTDCCQMYRFDDFNILPGQYFVVANDQTSIEFEVSPLKVTFIDLDNDTVSGIGLPNKNGWVDLGGETRDFQIAPDGTWTVDFSDIFDITPMNSGVIAYEQNNDYTYTQTWDQFPMLQVYPPNNSVLGFGWPEGDLVTLTINGNEYTDTQIVNFHRPTFDLSGVFDLEPGDVVTLSNGTYTNQVVATELIYLGVDSNLDKLWGTAAPGSEVFAGLSGIGLVRHVSVQSDGNWVIDLSIPGEDPEEMEVYDLQEGQVVYAQQLDYPDRYDGTTLNMSAQPYVWPVGDILTSPSGTTIVDIPSGALSSPAPISITEMGESFSLTTELGEASAVYGVEIGPAGTTFAIPISITMSWQDDDNDGIVDTTGQLEEALFISKDGVVITDLCQADPGCDPDANTFSFQVSSLSEFVLAAFSAPEILEITAPLEPVQLGNEVSVSAIFFDADTWDTHAAEWDWGDDTTSDGIVDDSTVTGAHLFEFPGVYTVSLTLTDDTYSDSASYEFVVIYDPEGGFVTGGGWIESLEGAYLPDPILTGKATFGFVSKYKKGAGIPEGNTEFQFKVADLNFQSTTYEWLVVTGKNNAQFKGTGTINGDGEYKFLIWAGDDDPDTFRIKIWEEDELGVETVIYDNGFDQAIEGGSIVVHTK